MTDPTLEQLKPLQAIPTIKILDIGGGTDEGFDSSYELRDEALAESVASLMGTRAVRLAKSNPNMSVTVFDPEVSVAAEEVANKVPNITFEEGRVDAEHPLPYEGRSMDEVEANHLFQPLMPLVLRGDEQKVKDIRAQRRVLDSEIQTLNGGGLLIHGGPLRPEDRQLQIEQRQDSVKTLIRQDMDLGLPDRIHDLGEQEDFANYMAVITEAARVLKPGGKLKIAEKNRTIETIRRLLSDEGEFDSEILKKVGLRFISLEPNNDELRSPYANRAESQSKDAREGIDAKKSDELQPMLLVFEKIGQ